LVGVVCGLRLAGWAAEDWVRKGHVMIESGLPDGDTCGTLAASGVAYGAWCFGEPWLRKRDESRRVEERELSD